MKDIVHIDLGHPDVEGQLRDVNRASSRPGATYITVPDWVRSLPAELAHEEPEERVTYQLLAGEYGEELALYGDGARGTIQVAYGAEAVERLDRSRAYSKTISLPKNSGAVLSEPIPSHPPPVAGEYVETSQAILDLITMYENVYRHALEHAHNDNVFWQVNAVIRDNPTLDEGKEYVFIDFVFESYAKSVAVGVRTMVDGRNDSDSLKRLLNGMAQNATLFTRARHCSMLRGLPKALANEGFDDLAGEGQSHVPRKVFLSWLEELEREVEIIREYVNKHVAHIARRGATRIPDAIHLRRGLVTVRETLKRCALVLRGESLMSSVPVIQSNWLKVFRIPWLPKGTRVPEYKHLDQLPYPQPEEEDAS